MTLTIDTRRGQFILTGSATPDDEITRTVEQAGLVEIVELAMVDGRHLK